MNTKSFTFSPQEAAALTLQELEFIKNNPDGFMHFGLKAIDNYVRSPRPGNLIITLGRPGHGKSSWLIFQARHTARNYGPVIFVSAEMALEELEIYHVAHLAKIDSDDLQRGNFDYEPVCRALGERGELPIWVLGYSIQRREKRPFLTMRAIDAAIEALVDKGVEPVRIIIDYAQRIYPERSFDRRKEVSEIVERAKDIANKYGCVVDLGSQANREVEERKPYPIPTLASGKETGNLEETPDYVFALWRPILTLGEDGVISWGKHNRTVTDTLFWFQPLKIRMGKCDQRGFWLHFHPAYNRFNEMELRYAEQ